MPDQPVSRSTALDDESGANDLRDLVDFVARRRRVPLATYRIQFNRSFTFADARRIVPYLSELGITDVYASPCLKAGRDSEHGYDIVDHSSLNPTLGSQEDLDRFIEELRARGMGLILDLVPNHMGISGDDNRWWIDVLENGPSSPHAPYFDIDWHPLKGGTDLEDRVLLPILGEPYGRALEGQKLTLCYADGSFFVTYHGWRMPIAPRSYAEILSVRLEDLTENLGDEHPHLLELRSILTAISYLPLETDTDPEKVAERQREKEIIKQRIPRLVEASPSIRQAITLTVNEYNGVAGDPRSFDALDNLLNGQSYRLSFWQVAAEEINYRRFFDVNELAAIRMEHPAVFEASHRLVMELVRRGQVTGLRIDHADGLWDPQAYLEQVQVAVFRALSQDWLDARFGKDGTARDEAESSVVRGLEDVRARDPTTPAVRPFYIVVEKILSPGETLPASWPVDGTTGYDMANLINALFVDPANRKQFNNLYASFARSAPSRFADLTNSTKKIIMLVSLASEINELGYRLKRIANQNRLYRDFTLNSLTHAIREVIASLSVYRTYLSDRTTEIDAHDRVAIEEAVAEAKRRNPRTAYSVFDFVRSVLLRQYPDALSDAEQDERSSFVMRFQQTTGPVMAKGVEDTAFYVYNRLLSLNEVGGDPEQFGLAPARFHQCVASRAASWPRSMNAGSTHDSKRSADVRARLNVLSEIPGAWHRAIIRWSARNRRRRTLIYGQPAPDRNDEYFIYQTLVGAWPAEPMNEAEGQAFRQRIVEYVQKAFKEAKVHTSWVNPNRQYDDAVASFVERILSGPLDVGFLPDFLEFQSYVSFFGMLNSLAQTLIQLTVPGVPDVYQGTEMWCFNLVDPDNRRPVDFERRRDALARITRAVPARGPRARRAMAVAGSSWESPGVEGSAVAGQMIGELLERWRDGTVKLHVTCRALGARQAYEAAYRDGAYWPLAVVGNKQQNAIAFARSSGDEVLLTVVPRLMVSLTRGATVFPLGSAVWADTAVLLPSELVGKRFHNLMTDEHVDVANGDGALGLRLADVFETFPVALLRRE